MSPWLSLTLVMLFTGAGLCAVVVFLMARMLLTPPRMTDGKALVVLQRLTPADLALEYEELWFDIRDESNGQDLRIANWWIPARGTSDRTVLVIHGYSDAKVGGIAWAPMFHTLGWNILAVDLRAHGESGGQFSTAGYWERHDLNQVINRFRAIRPRQTQTLVLFGVSLGAACALATAVTRDDIAALILEGPFTSFRDAVHAHGRLMGAPGGWMQTLALRLAEWLAHADFAAVRPVDLIPQAPCPVLIFHAAQDCFMIQDESARLQDALARHNNPHDAFYEFDSAGHVLCLACDPEAYRQKIESFLQQIALSDSPAPTRG